MTPPAISVLLPVRDGADHLPECIASLVGQTEPDFEVIAVDDGSRDGSWELLSDWAARDPRVRPVRQDALGLVPALERGRAEARGRWLARMDADDVALPSRFHAQRARMEEDDSLAVCGAGIRYMPRHELRGGALRYERWINSLGTPESVVRELFVECPLAHPTFFMRAAAVDAVGGYRDRGWPEDYDLLLRLWRSGWRLASIPQVLLHWREGDARLSRTHPSYSPAAFRRCKAHHLARSLLREREVVVWGAGPTGKAFARALAEEGVRPRAFVDLDPRKIGQRIQEAPVLAPAQLERGEGRFCVAAVAQPGGREQIRGSLTAAGWIEGTDFVAVA